MPPINPLTSRLRSVSARWVACLLVAMLLAQALGLMHRVAHGGPLAAVAAAQSQAAAKAAPPQAGTHAWVGGLFAGHDDTSCRLYDLLHHPGVAPEPPAPLAALPSGAQPPGAAPAFVLAARDGFFQARAPPSAG
ncbi:MAG TPA: hypothetical protein VLJ58_16760 [Ramlibacter sp.]|nr:hypothetical protein [Ramlibacter sp.]